MLRVNIEETEDFVLLSLLVPRCAYQFDIADDVLRYGGFGKYMVRYTFVSAIRFVDGELFHYAPVK